MLFHTNPTSPIEEACARDIFAKFMYFVPNLITNIGGTTVAIPSVLSEMLPGQRAELRDGPRGRADDTTRMRNSALSGLIESVRRSGIFTEEEALIAIVPPIWAANKLPKLGEKSKESVFMEEWLKSG